MSDYSSFFLMKPEDVKRYAVEVLHFFQPDEETDCIEIGDRCNPSMCRSTLHPAGTPHPASGYTSGASPGC